MRALARLLRSTRAACGDRHDEGFGASTPGGSGKAIVHVTNLGDAGPGSLREALNHGNRTIRFQVAGDIVLQDFLYVSSAYVTIDGTTAPPPGITLRAAGLVIRGAKGAHDVVVRGLRIRDSRIDGIQVSYGAYRVVIDHVSVSGSSDGNLDITSGSATSRCPGHPRRQQEEHADQR